MLLADRVIVMTPRPGRVKEVLAIDLQCPRTMAVVRASAYADACERIRALLDASAVIG